MRNIFFLYWCFFFSVTFGQSLKSKEINNQFQSWVSINSVLKFDEKWACLLDFHIRENKLFESNNFYFARAGIGYFPKPNIMIAGGYAHLWLAPTKPGWELFTNENRIYQQVQMINKIGSISFIQRIRNEQRWQEKIVNDERIGAHRFTNRVRYLLSFTIPISNNKNTPSIVVADEILLHFGKEVVYNTLDQNRIFVGIKQNLTQNLSFDFGYMYVFQQKYSGYQYDANHTLRLFFYYTQPFKKKPQVPIYIPSEE